MLKRYTLLVSVILASLFGIIILQTYLVYNDYQIRSYEFQQEVNQLFEETVEEEKLARLDSFMVFTRSLISDSTQIEINATYSERTEKTIYSLRDLQSEAPYTSVSYSKDERKLNHLDSLNLEITLDLIMESIREQTQQGMNYHWTEKLAEKMTNYQTDTLFTDEQLGHSFRKRLDQKKIKSGFEILRTQADSLKLSKPASGDFTTAPFLSQFWDQDATEVQAIINAPFSEIVGRMNLTLASSILLILLTAISFSILLRIIFKQKKLSQIKDDFIDNITHELQTPIATLMAANEGMEKYQALEDPEKSKRYLSISKMELQRLSKMVDNILLSSIHNRESMILEWERVNVPNTIKFCTNKYQLKTNKSVQFDLDFEEESMEILTDKLHLQNILDNLIENAIKHNESELKIVQIRTKRLAEHTQIIVSDNGKGIPEEQREKVFEKFYRISKETGQVKGFGIGLYYIKTILKQLNGQIHIAPSSTQGTSFILSLPVNKHEI